MRIHNGVTKKLHLALLCICTFLSGLSPASDITQLDIGAPLDFLKPSELHDSFNELHHGHRHEAIDIMRPRGSPIHSVTNGAIRKLFTSRQGGLTIYEIDRAGTYCYYYAHLDFYPAGLREGMPISRGDVIGYVGTTGNAAQMLLNSISQFIASVLTKVGGKVSRSIPIQFCC